MNITVSCIDFSKNFPLEKVFAEKTKKKNQRQAIILSGLFNFF